MPVFQEAAGSDRDLRVLPSRAPPLPRLTPDPAADQDSRERYEVVVIGVRLLPFPHPISVISHMQSIGRASWSFPYAPLSPIRRKIPGLLRRQAQHPQSRTSRWSPTTYPRSFEESW